MQQCLCQLTIVSAALQYTKFMCTCSRVCICVQIVDRGLQTSLVIEDDLRFEVFFRRRLQTLLQEVTTHKLDWDLMWVTLQWTEGKHDVVNRRGLSSPYSEIHPSVTHDISDTADEMHKTLVGIMHLSSKLLSCSSVSSFTEIDHCHRTANRDELFPKANFLHLLCQVTDSTSNACMGMKVSQLNHLYKNEQLRLFFFLFFFSWEVQGT